MVEQELPDFDDFIRLADTIRQLKIEFEGKKFEVAALKARITTYVMSHKELWENENKPPSNAHIRDTFHVIGYDEETRLELLTLINTTASLESQLDYLDKAFYISKIKVDVWRTQSANKRSSFI
jgi:hypothetical protein